jgi:hypothetical protein
MCNIINSPCIICGADLPLHLGDYDTAPEEVVCYCEQHLPTLGCRIYTLIEDDIDPEYYIDGDKIERPKGWKMGIRAITTNAFYNEDKNYPNTFAEWEWVDV